MHAIRIHAPGGPEVLSFEEVALPDPGPGQALVRHEAIGVNFIDVYHRTGLYPMARPFTPGLEAAGVVERIGEDVTTVRPGDRVAYGDVPGAYAEEAIVPADRLVPVPDGVGSEEAAALMLQGMTAHYLTMTTRPLGPGDSCLIHAAAGGLGLLLCQLAHRLGARIIATVSTEAKAALAREAGADEVILYTQQDFEAETRRLTGGAGVQVVYDSVGKTTFEGGLRVLAPLGTMVLCGQSSGPVLPFDPQLLAQRGSLILTRPRLFDYIRGREALLKRAGDVLGWVAEGSLKVRIGGRWALSRAGDAHRALEGRSTTGKVLLTPDTAAAS
jgi:NADPH2:quinone reductase